MKTVLVTGAAGFIGSYLVLELLKNGVQVVGIDNLNDYYDVRLKEYRLQQISKTQKDFHFSKIDIENKSGLEELFKKHKFDVVFNLAARAGVRYSMENPDIYLSTNTQGTLNILNCMKNASVKKLVLASTSSLYAGCEMPFVETLPVNTPISPYAASKKAAELMAYSYHYLYGIDVSVVRYFTVYGPAGRPDMSIYRFIKWIHEGQPIELFGDGTQSRDFTYVEDIARGTYLAAKNVGYEIINLGGGKNPISLNTIITNLENYLGKEAQMDKKAFHKADIKETWADISKAEKILGWKPTVGIEQGLKNCVSWHIENQNFLKDIKLP